MSTPSLLHVISAALDVSEEAINEDSNMENTPGWDSLKQLIVVSEIERVYRVKFSFQQMTDESNSVSSIRQLLATVGVTAD